MILRFCILISVMLSLALPAGAAMPQPGTGCPSEEGLASCPAVATIALLPARPQAEPPCIWKAMLAGTDPVAAKAAAPTELSLTQGSIRLQGIIPGGPERPPRPPAA